MNVDIDQLLEKWADARSTISTLEKKVDNYKKIAKQYLIRHNLTKYENDFFKLRQSTQNRSIMHKKDVPKDVWAQYARAKDIEFLTLTEKKATKTKSQQQLQQQLR